MPRLCVFCGSHPGSDPAYRRAAATLGAVLVERGIELVYGGGRVGMMGTVADAALAAGGRVIGVIPQALVEREAGHTGLTELRVVHSMHERKAMMADLSDGFIALPGGVGTLDELFEVWTWGQLGLHAKPCGLLNVAGFFDPLVAYLDHLVQTGFVSAPHRAMLHISPEPETLLAAFAAYRPPPARRWIRENET